MIRVGIVGLGFMGRMHYRCWAAQPGVQITAVVEANPKVLEEAASGSATGNIGGAADRIDLGSLKVYSSLDELLAEGGVDAVSITVPTFLHADLTIAALNSGVHVLCEKPMALSIDECDRMIAAAQSSGKVLQVGHCIRFWPEYSVTRDLIHSGSHGKVVAASFRRLASMPSWNPDNWFADEARSGGQPMDLHIHDTDFVHYVFGVPAQVSSAADSTLGFLTTQYAYGDGKAVTAEGCWRMAGSFGFEMSFNVVLERATIVYDCTRSPAFKVCPTDGEAFTPELPAGDGYTREIDHFARAVAGELVDPVVTPQQSRDTVRIVLAEKLSAREGRPIPLN
jgi:predicted dehydrogenase